MENELTRGIRNNNPFNIRRTQIVWKGESKDTYDKDFEEFTQMCWGLRAGIKLLSNYIRNGFNTPKKILYRFAPPSENDTKAYLDYLVNSGFVSDINKEIHVATPEFWSLCSGICYYESRYELTRDIYHRIVANYL